MDSSAADGRTAVRFVLAVWYRQVSATASGT